MIDTLPVSVCSTRNHLVWGLFLVFFFSAPEAQVFQECVWSCLAFTPITPYYFFVSLLVALIRGWEIRAGEAAGVLSVSASLKVELSVMWF